MNRSPAERLRDLRLKKGFETAKDAADAFGWKVVTYRSHENGTREIPYPAAKRYALAYGATAQYIMGDSTIAPASQQIVNHLTTVPVVGMVAAGTFRHDEFQRVDDMEVPAIPKKGVPASAQYAVLVDGPSVNRRIPDGMYAICVLFDHYPGGAQHGSLVHVVRETAGLYEHTIKELHYTATGRELRPASSDPAYQEVVKLDNGTDPTVRIHGVVIGQYQPL